MIGGDNGIRIALLARSGLPVIALSTIEALPVIQTFKGRKDIPRYAHHAPPYCFVPSKRCILIDYWDRRTARKTASQTQVTLAMTIAELIKRERPLVQKIILDEMWLCGERHGMPVDRYDKEVQENVCRIIIKNGDGIRKQAESERHERHPLTWPN